MSASFTAVHVPEFPVVAWRLAAPHLRSHPCAVLEGVAPLERVTSLCERAEAVRIAHGMSKVQAEAGGTVLFHPRQIDEEESAYALLLEITERFSPKVQAIASPLNGYADADRLAAVLLLDSAGMGTLFGRAESYAPKLHEELRKAGFPAGIGSAPNAEAAVMLARSSRKVVCADRDSLRGKLATLPITLLPCEPQVMATLVRWGVRTLGQLAALPEAALVSRLGQAGRRLQLLARGETDSLLVPEEPTFTLLEKAVFDSPVELLDSLLFVLSPLLESMLRKAMERAYALRSVVLTLQLERRAPHHVQVRPAVPTQNREALLKLLHLALEADPPKAGVVEISLKAEPAKPQVAQRGLFQAQFPEPDRLELLLARLRSIAGEGNVGSLQLQNSRDDERFALVPFRPSPHGHADRQNLSSRTAMRVFRPPQPVRVAVSTHQPQTLFWQGSRFAIASCAGPWHASGSWWDSTSWNHELWDVVTAEPHQGLQLRHERASNAWFVVGLYD